MCRRLRAGMNDDNPARVTWCGGVVMVIACSLRLNFSTEMAAILAIFAFWDKQ